MVQSSATTVKAYLDQLEPEQRRVLSRVRKCIRDNLPKGYTEVMNRGMISYEIPLAHYPKTYNKKPLLYCAIAAQKHHYAIYMMCIYSGSNYLKRLESGYKKAGIKLDAGKCCVRFKNLEEVHLPTIARIVSACSPGAFIKLYEKSRKQK